MIERQQVISAYQLLLGRSPESEAVVAHHASLPDLAALGQALMTSDEFRRRAAVGDFPKGRQQWVCAEIRNGLRLWLDLMDLGVGAGALRDDWEPAETAFILSHLDAGDGFLDIGANIGWFTVLAAERVGPSGHVYAFEPRRDLYRRLRDSVAVNGMLERCTLFNMALGEASTKMPINSVPDESNPGHSFLVRAEKVGEGQMIDTVSVERLDALSIGHKITLMKIDVEGAEAMVLSGAIGLIERDHPFLITEFFPEWLRKVSGVEPGTYLDMLRHHGYRLFELTESGIGAAVSYLPDGVAEPGFFLNLAATPDAKPFRALLPPDRIARTPAIDAVDDTSPEALHRQIARLGGEIGQSRASSRALEERIQSLCEQAQVLAGQLERAANQLQARAHSTMGLSDQVAALDGKLEKVLNQVSKSRRPVLAKILREIKKPFTRAFWSREREKLRTRNRARKARRLTSGISGQGGWAEVERRRATHAALAGVDRPIVMIIDDRLPEPDRDSGSLDAVNMVSSLIDCGYHVIFAVSTNRQHPSRCAENLRALGAYPLQDQGSLPVQAFIETYGVDVDLFVLNRVGGGGQFLELIRYNAPDAKIAFNTVDLHYIREARAARLARDNAALAASERTRDREEAIAGRSDMTYVVSSVEEEILRASVPGCATTVLPLSRTIRRSDKGFGERHGVGFIGGFEHEPNIDAIRYFLGDIWPLIHQSDPDISFEIVGSDLPEDVLQGVVGKVSYLGQLPTVEGWFDSLRMTVAPLRIGAGAKGKVASSLCNGLPTVLSPVAAEGMSLGVGRDVLVGTNATEFARQVVQLHNDPDLWAKLSTNGLAFAEANLSVATFKARFRESLIDMDLPAMALESGALPSSGPDSAR